MKRQVQKKKNLILCYYTKTNENGSLARCNLCQQIGKQTLISIKYCIYRMAQKHLNQSHNIFFGERKHRKPALTYEKVKNRLRELYVIDMVCNHQIPLKSISSSPFFSKAFQALSLNIANIAEIFSSELQIKKHQIRNTIYAKKMDSQTFSVSMKIIKQRNCAIFHLHFQDGTSQCLGLFELNENSLYSQLSIKLEQYLLNIDRDILAICEQLLQDSEFKPFNESIQCPLGSNICLIYLLHTVIQSVFTTKIDFSISSAKKSRNCKIESQLSLIPPYQQLLHRVRTNSKVIIQSQTLSNKLYSETIGKKSRNLLLDEGGNWISSFLMIQRYSQLLYEADSLISEIQIETTFDLHLQNNLRKVVEILKPFFLLQMALAQKDVNLLKIIHYCALIRQQIGDKVVCPLSLTLKQSFQKYFFPNIKRDLSQTIQFLSVWRPIQPINQSKAVILKTIQKLMNANLQKHQMNQNYLSSSKNELETPMKGYTFAQISQSLQAYGQSLRKDQILETAERRILSIPMTISECQQSYSTLKPFLQEEVADNNLQILESVLFLGKESATQLQFYKNHHLYKEQELLKN